jgi:hypothetical protein
MRGILRRAHFMRVEKEVKDLIRQPNLDGEGRPQHRGSDVDLWNEESDSRSGQIVDQLSSAMKNTYIKEALAKASSRLNRKKEREKFIPQDLTVLLNDNIMQIKFDELPRTSNAEFTSVSYIVPLIRQYILFSNVRLAQTVQLVKENFVYYERFMNI